MDVRFEPRWRHPALPGRHGERRARLIDADRAAQLVLRQEHRDRIGRGRARAFCKLQFDSAAVLGSHNENLAAFSAERNRHRSRIDTTRGPCCASLVRVFAQRAETAIDLVEMLNATRRYFDANLDVQSRSDDGKHVELILHCEKHGYEGRLSIRARAVTRFDVLDAREAEERGQASGMGSLAERCHTVWEVESVGADSELARLNLCAILAAVGLGPVLPDDGATLYGVRGSMERVERLLRARR